MKLTIITTNKNNKILAKKKLMLQLRKEKKKIMKICCIGAVYVGGPTIALIVLKCPSIEETVIDISKLHIAAQNTDKIPIYEPSLHDVVKQCRHKNLFFSTYVEKHDY
jgi:UDPglucose 6-dehydrogenase